MVGTWNLGVTNDDFIFRSQGGLVEKFRITQAGSANFTDNLSVSGILQSPLTSLLSVSAVALENNKMDKTLVGTSISNLNSKDITIGASAVALETNKMDNTLIGTSISNLNNTIGGLGIIVIGISLSALETNKMDRNLIETSHKQFHSKKRIGTATEFYITTRQQHQPATGLQWFCSNR